MRQRQAKAKSELLCCETMQNSIEALKKGPHMPFCEVRGICGVSIWPLAGTVGTGNALLVSQCIICLRYKRVLPTAAHTFLTESQSSPDRGSG